MSENKKPEESAPAVAIASDTVKTQIANLSLANMEKDKVITELQTERDQLKQQCIELASVIENDLKADLTIKIAAASQYQPADLATMTVEQLQAIEETLTKAKGYSPQANYKSIRAGNASQNVTRLTVGDLYGKSREEILKMNTGGSN
jgi:hypothetical protein